MLHRRKMNLWNCIHGSLDLMKVHETIGWKRKLVVISAKSHRIVTKWHFKNKWSTASISSLHNGQRESRWTHLLAKFPWTGRLLRVSCQKKKTTAIEEGHRLVELGDCGGTIDETASCFFIFYGHVMSNEISNLRHISVTLIKSLWRMLSTISFIPCSI